MYQDLYISFVISAAHEAAVVGLRVYIVRKERQLDVSNVASL